MNQKTLTQDFIASLVVFLVALPLCMGVAIASGVPPAAGLITGIIGGLIVGAISGAPLQVSGPAAGLVVIVYQLVQDHGIEMLGPVLMLAGLLQIAAGALRIGQWFRAITPYVIYGMLAGIGVLIFSSQFHVMLDDKPRSNGLLNIVSIPAAIYAGIFPIDGSPHEIAAVIGITSILILVLWGKFHPAALKFIPGALLAVVAATAIAQWNNIDMKYVTVPANLLEAVRLPTMATLQKLMAPDLLLEAFGMAFVASAETLLSAVAVDKMHDGPRAKYDRELMAQGFGNLLCGICGALPMTGVIVRSSANVQAGARTRLSTMLHALWLLIMVVALPGLLSQIPTACLAAILVYTGIKLMSVENIRRLRVYGWQPVAIYAATVIGIVVTDLLKGVILGLALSIFKMIYTMTHLNIRVETSGRKADLHLIGSATFIRLPALADALDALPPGTQLHVHVDKLIHIDHACLEVLGEWEQKNQENGSTMVVEWDELKARYQATSKTVTA